MSNFDEDFIFTLPQGNCESAGGIDPRVRQASHRATEPSGWLASVSLLEMTSIDLLFPIGRAHSGPYVALNTVRRNGVAQPVFGKRLHSCDCLGQMRRF